AMGRQRCAEVFEEWLQCECVSRGVVVSADELSRKPVQHIQRFIRHARTTDDADPVSAVLVGDRIETFSDVTNRFIPRRGNQFAALLVANHWRADARLLIHERMTEPAYDAQKLAIDAVDVT